jgi:hypothetical protein
MEEPLDYSEANQHEDWKLAIKSEMDSIMKNQTWEVIDRPTGKNPITAKWIFKVKRGSSGQVSKLKVRIVPRGFQQRAGIDYNDIFALVVRWSTIRTILFLQHSTCGLFTK